jgi:hypothetical protein
MNDTNPFSSPSPVYSDLQPQDPHKLKQYAKKLAMLRVNPPTLIGMLGGWRLLLSITIGVVFTLSVGWLFRDLPRPYNAFPPVMVGFMFLGAISRDIGTIIRVARFWKLQAHFIDWNKVEEFQH